MNELDVEIRNMIRMRGIFWAHVIVAFSCLACGRLDKTGNFQEWIIPNVGVLCFLVLSGFLFTAIASVISLKVPPPLPILLLFTHVVLSFVQIFFGLIPLMS